MKKPSASRKPGGGKRPRSIARRTPVEAHVPPTRASRRRAVDTLRIDASLFAPLSEGERADAVRTLLEDDRLRALAKLGRYRVVAVEALAVKPPDALAGRRLARIQLYDYAADRCVEACVDLDRGAVCHVSTTTAQPMLSRDEEVEATQLAQNDERVRPALAGGASAVGVMHYWSLRPTEIPYRRRSAAVLFGVAGKRPTLVAVVNLIDRVVLDVVTAEQW